MLSLAQQLERVPIGYSFTKETPVKKVKQVCNMRQREAMLDLYCRAMYGNGPMTSAQIALATKRERTSVNLSLRKFLVPLGVIRKVGEIPRSGSAMPTYLYEWVGED